MGQFHILPAYENFMQNQCRGVVCIGTAGSAKSKHAAFKTMLRVFMEEPGFRALAGRKQHSEIKNSVYAECVKIIQELGWESAFKITESPMRLKCLKNGNDVVFFGIDEEKKLKSIQGIKHVWYDEAIELEEKDYDQLQYRVRGLSATYKQVILTLNPDYTDHWIYKRFIENEEPNCYVFNTSFEDNPYIAEEDKLQWRGKNTSEALKMNLTHGLWNTRAKGNAFYHQFNTTMHVSDCPVVPYAPLHLSFDFNVHPYITLLIAQKTGDTWRFLDEICLGFPNSNTYALAAKFKQWYYKHCNNGEGIYIYGDPAGNHLDTRTAESDYYILRHELKEFSPQFRVPKVSPPVKQRGEWINNVMAGKNPIQSGTGEHLRIIVSPRCTNLIQDYLNIRQEVNGGKLKTKVTLDDGVIAEKYGHASDAADYLLCEAEKECFEAYYKPRAKFAIRYGKRPPGVW